MCGVSCAVIQIMSEVLLGFRSESLGLSNGAGIMGDRLGHIQKGTPTIARGLQDAFVCFLWVSCL